MAVPRNYGTAFLPATYQGTALGRAGMPATEATIRNLKNSLQSAANSVGSSSSCNRLNREQMARMGHHDTEYEAVLNSYELAWRLQNKAPLALDLAQESEATLKMYGISEQPTDNFGRQCLMARRWLSRACATSRSTTSDNSNNPAWDQHSNLPKHAEHAANVDKPVWALVQDLKQRGLLEAPSSGGAVSLAARPIREKNGTGRDHNPGGFTVWLAGGGFKAGHSHGETDDRPHGDQGQGAHARPARDHPASDGARPREADLPLRRT